MTSKETGNPHDTRGLPMSLDPRNFYEYKSQKIVSEGTSGVEMLVWRLIPYSYIKSFAIAIDPLWKFRVSPARITSVNRTRIKTSSSVLDRIISHNHRTNVTSYSTTGGLGCNKADYSERSRSEQNYTTNVYIPSKGLASISKDTSYSSRPFGSDYGECELFKFSISSPPRSYHYYEYQSINWSSNVVGCEPNHPRKHDVKYDSHYSIGPSGSYLTQASLDSIRSETKIDIQTLFSRHGMSLVRQALPASRDFNLARSVIELRDVHRSIESLQKAVKHFASLASSRTIPSIVFDTRRVARDIPNEYLSYHFGWKQLYNDILSALYKPARIQRRINRLMERSGLATTYRSEYRSSDSYVRGSGFVYPIFSMDESYKVSHRVTRDFVLSCAIQAKFDFPPTDKIKFRDELFTRMLGVYPNPTDVYNLVPWTWLFDWFTGFGNYLDIIEEINKDRSLINFGFLACKCKGSLVSSLQSKLTSSIKNDIDHVQTTVRPVVLTNHSSVLDFSLYVREDVTKLTDIKSITDMSKLSTFQRSILGALVLQRARF